MNLNIDMRTVTMVNPVPIRTVMTVNRFSNCSKRLST